MDIEKIEKKLKRINTVLEAFKEDSKISTIEKDLLLGYMRELYELIRDSEADELDLPKVHKEFSIEPPKAKDPIEEIVIEKIIEVMPDVPKVEVDALQNKAEIVTQKSEVPIVEEKRLEEKKPSTPAEHMKPKTTINVSISSELEAIFVKEEITDLADKLSMMKIQDIAQAIGINSRLVMINELFNGDGNLFNTTIKKLNNCSNFEEAKLVLINEIALPMNWEKEDKLKEAQQLVKLVMRKFS